MRFVTISKRGFTWTTLILLLKYCLAVTEEPEILEPQINLEEDEPPKLSKIQEYGIVVLPDQVCSDFASSLNADISKILSDLPVVKNTYHISLYHGAFRSNDTEEIFAQLTEKLKPLKPFNLTLTTIFSKNNQWIFYGVQNTEYLQHLHVLTVLRTKDYRKRNLEWVTKIFDSLGSEQKKLVEKYGTHNVLQEFKPHMTLFYQYPPDKRLQEAAETIATQVSAKNETQFCEGSKLVLAELGFNGNVEKILHSVDLTAPEETLTT